MNNDVHFQENKLGHKLFVQANSPKKILFCQPTWLSFHVVANQYFTFEWLVTLEVFSGFFICIDFEKETKSKQEKRSDCSQQHHKKGRHASFLYYFKNKEYNIITQENSNG